MSNQNVSNFTNQCELCSNKYPSDMIINKNFCDFIQCYDCLFSMNYNDKQILNGNMGIKLSEYIETSIKYHTLINEIPCNRLGDTGGCYVCMKLLDIPFDIPNDNINNNMTNELINKQKNDKPIINTDPSYKVLDIKLNDDISFDNNFVLSL